LKKRRDTPNTREKAVTPCTGVGTLRIGLFLWRGKRGGRGVVRSTPYIRRGVQKQGGVFFQRRKSGVCEGTRDSVSAGQKKSKRGRKKKGNIERGKITAIH